MRIEQILSEEINESKRWIYNAEGVYKRDLIKRIALINWGFREYEKFRCCYLWINGKQNEVILKINQTHDIFADKLHNEFGILDWIFYQVCKDEQKNA